MLDGTSRKVKPTYNAVNFDTVTGAPGMRFDVDGYPIEDDHDDHPGDSGGPGGHGGHGDPGDPSPGEECDQRIERREFFALIDTYSSWLRLPKEPENPGLPISSVPPVVLAILEHVRVCPTPHGTRKISIENTLALCVTFGFERIAKHEDIAKIRDLRNRFVTQKSDGSTLWRTISDAFHDDAKIGMEKGRQWNPPMNAHFLNSIFTPVLADLGIEKTSFAVACILAYLLTQADVPEKTKIEFREALTRFFIQLGTKAAKLERLITEWEKAKAGGTPGDHDPLRGVPRSKCLDTLLQCKDSVAGVLDQYREKRRELEKIRKKLPEWYLEPATAPETDAEAVQ